MATVPSVSESLATRQYGFEMQRDSLTTDFHRDEIAVIFSWVFCLFVCLGFVCLFVCSFVCLIDYLKPLPR